MARIDRVRRVPRYRVARYPSHADPDPSTYPDPVPFPFQREFLRAVAGVGLAAGLINCSPGSSQEGAGVSPPREQAVTEAPANTPFPLSVSGLPFRTSPYGTGQPSYISDQLARDAIDKIFRQAGFRLEKDFDYHRDGVRARLTGFDAKHRIGYVFADHRTLDEDGYVSWATAKAGALTEPTDDPATARQWLSSMDWRFGAISKDLQKSAQAVLAMKDGKPMLAAYRKVHRQLHDHLLSMAEAKRLEEEAPKEKEFVAVISQFDNRLLDYGRWHRPPDPTLQKLIERYNKQIDPEAQKELGRKIEALRLKKQLETLERNVREYIAWARAQGLQ